MRIDATFPALRCIDVHTDGATLPSTSLFDIAQDCITSPTNIAKVQFCGIGCFFATARHKRFTLTVQYKEVTDLWLENVSLTMDPDWQFVNVFKWKEDSLAGQVYRVFFTRLAWRTEKVANNFTGELVKDFNTTMTTHCPAIKACSIDDDEFWTDAACPYVAYKASDADME